jgi:hypothetical protein
MEKNIKNVSSFDSSKSNNISKDMIKEPLNISNSTIEEILDMDDIIDKMSDYKNKSIFAQ